MNEFEKANPTYMNEIKEYAREIIDEKQYGSLEYILIKYDRYFKTQHNPPPFNDGKEHPFWKLCFCSSERYDLSNYKEGE